MSEDDIEMKDQEMDKEESEEEVLDNKQDSDKVVDSNNTSNIEENEEEEEEEEEDIKSTPSQTKKSSQQKESSISKSPLQLPKPEPPKSSQQTQSQSSQTKKSSQQQQSSASTPILGGSKVGEKRLMITKMVMENFKSYAGRQEVGPFHKCFSSIVGPNGSGKSNVIDAMLFVFGYRAKQIRQNKISELIHNSENHKDLQMGKVSVYFQDIIDLPGDDEYEVVPNSEFVVTRTAPKKGESKYYLNDKTIKLDELKPFLKNKGIDLDNNRFLILQGEVEQIAMMKPKGQNSNEEGLLEYLEDIIGSKKYLEDIEATYKLVESANEKKTTSNQRMKIVEKERDALQADKDRAQEFIDKEMQLIKNKFIYFQVAAEEPKREIEELKDKQQQVEQKLAKEKEEQEESNSKLLECEKSLKKQNKELDELNKQLAKCKSESLSIEKKSIKYKEEIKHLNTKIKKNTSVIEEETKKQSEYERTKVISKQNIARLEKEAVELPKELAEEEDKLETMMDSLKGEISQFQQEMEEKQKELLPWSKKHSEAKAVVDLKQSELNVLSKDNKNANSNLEDAVKALEESKLISTSRKTDISNAKKELEQVKQKIQSFEKQYQQNKSSEEKLYSQLIDARRQLEQIKVSLSESSSRNSILDRLMKLRETGQINGIHGRLGDLGAIDQKYDVAISTAAFSQMDNIIVDNTATAEACVEVLRKENLGRATFMILENIEFQRARLSASIQTPNNAPRLFDLIEMKDKKRYCTAFYSALGDTLVAESLDEASQLAYGGSKRYRVVTIDGNLIDTSGAMSGGGTKPRAGAMNSKLKSDPKEDKKQMVQLEEQVFRLESELRACRDEIASIETQIQESNKRKSQLEVELPKMEMDIKAALAKCEELTKIIPQLEAKSKLSSEKKQEIEKIQESLAKDQKELDKIQKTVDKLLGEIQKIQNEILNVGGPQLKMQKLKVESLTNSVDTNQSDITKAQVQIKSMDKLLEKSQKVSNENSKEKEINQEKLQSIQEKLNNLEKETKQANQENEQISDQLREKEEETKEIRKEYEKAKKIIDKIKISNSKLEESIQDIKSQIEEKQAIVSEFVKKMDHQRKKRENYKDYISGDDSNSNSNTLILTSDELLKYAEPEENQKLVATINSLALELQNIGKESSINIEVIKEYQVKEADYQSKKNEFDQIEKERDTLLKKYEQLRKNRLDEFMEGFTIITMKLKEIYQMITLGGDAELEIIDREDPFEEGISFSVRPPKKSWKNISNLSGGEKTLSSLALVFALHHYKPTALYVMDEIDAALDFKNVSIIANYIKERTKNAQFIIISLRNYMFELADRLVGIYKTYNCTKSITINPHSFASSFNQQQ